MEEKKTYKGCVYLDIVFGDCCHPKSVGCRNTTWAIEECGDDHKYKVTKEELKDFIIDM